MASFLERAGRVLRETKVSDIRDRLLAPHLVEDSMPLEFALSFFVSKGYEALIVVGEGNRVEGIVTLSDIFRALVDVRRRHYLLRRPGIAGGKALVMDVMTPHPVTVDVGATLYDAVESMLRFGISHLIVTEDGSPVGLLTDRVVIEYLTERLGCPRASS